VGKRVEWNKEANQRLTKLFSEKSIRTCEIRFTGCLVNYALNFCHKEKRRHYNSVEELSDFGNVILGCQHCHTILDDRSKTTKEHSDDIFERQRGFHNGRRLA